MSRKKKKLPRYKKGSKVLKALLKKQEGGLIAYDPSQGYKAGQTVDAGGGNLYRAVTDIKAGTAGLGSRFWEKIEPAKQQRQPFIPKNENTAQRAADIPDLYTQYPGLNNPPAGMVLNPNYIPTQQPSATNPYFIPQGTPIIPENNVTQQQITNPFNLPINPNFNPNQPTTSDNLPFLIPQTQATTNFTSPVNTMQGSPQQTTVIAAEEETEEETEEDPYPIPEDLAPQYTIEGTTFILNPNYDPTKPPTVYGGSNPYYVLKTSVSSSGVSISGNQVTGTEIVGGETEEEEEVETVDTSNFLTLTDKESGTEYTFDPDLYPPGYRSLDHIESGYDYSGAPPYPLREDFETYAEYKTAFDAHTDGAYEDWKNSLPKDQNGYPIFPKLKTDSTIKTTTSNQNVTDTTENTSNETTQPRTDLGTITTTQAQQTDDEGNVAYSAPRSVITPPALPEAPIPVVGSIGTRGGVDSLSNAEVLRLKTLMDNENADPRQRQLAEERLNEVGISTDIKAIGTTTQATAGTIGATGTQQRIGLERAATLQGLFGKDAQGRNIASTYTADQADAASLAAATGAVSRKAEASKAGPISTLQTQRARADEQAALAEDEDFVISDGSYVGKVTGRTVNVAPTKEAEAAQREKISDYTLPEGQEAKIEDALFFEAAQRRTVTGTAAKGQAASMVAQVGDIPAPIAAAIVEDPATVEAQVDNEPIEIQAAIAALPTEALVSSQMETLLAGIDEGVTPAWARPAVARVNDIMAARGLSASTVGRDALFNAIIQTALPLAQSNAQALQQRAAQNLSNEQQANMSQATLDMQRRMANLSNQQTAGSQTAQLAQNMATLQSQFRQQAILTSEQQGQQIRVQSLANQQEASKVSALNQQAINAQELNNEQQIELADLQYLNATEKENMTAEQQSRLAEFQIGSDYIARNAAFKQQMEVANLDAESKVRLANLSALNDAAGDQMTADQQTELANLQSRVNTNITSAKIAESMGIAQLNVDQQKAVINAQTVAKIDLAKFSAGQQIELANSKFMQTATLTDFTARQQSALQDATTLAQMNMQEADLQTKASITNANNFLQMDLTNLSNSQQAAVINAQLAQQTALSNQAANNAALQFNAASQNQVDQFMTTQANAMEQYNTSQFNAMQQFNATEANRLSAIDAGNNLEASRLNAQLSTQVSQFNAQTDFQREQWNTANAQAIAQSNVEWRRQANTVDTAAQNAANMTNAQMNFNLTTAEQQFLWQNLRDEATYIRTAFEQEEQRKVAMLSTALQNEALAEKGGDNARTLIEFIAGLF